MINLYPHFKVYIANICFVNGAYRIQGLCLYDMHKIDCSFLENKELAML